MELSTYLTFTPVASAIFAITIAFSIWAFYNDEVYGHCILHPYSVYRGKNLYTLLTSGLIHADIPHLLFNMMSFYAFAFVLEVTIGHWQFALLYIACLILSDLPTVIKHRDRYQYHSLGASGAISGIVFAYILIHPLDKLGLMFIPIPLPAVVFGVLYLIYCVYASRRALGNINHDAHFYGALFGVLIVIALYPQVLKNFFLQLGLHF